MLIWAKVPDQVMVLSRSIIVLESGRVIFEFPVDTYYQVGAVYFLKKPYTYTL